MLTICVFFFFFFFFFPFFFLVVGGNNTVFWTQCLTFCDDFMLVMKELTFMATRQQLDNKSSGINI